jgi:hypothetical protein
MFNSKKIQKMLQQQELLDAKINSLAHGQKTLSEDFEVHFKRLRQSIYSIAEELSQLSKDNYDELSKQLKKKEDELIELTKKQEDRWLKLEQIAKLLYPKAEADLKPMPVMDKMKYKVQDLEEQKSGDWDELMNFTPIPLEEEQDEKVQEMISLNKRKKRGSTSIEERKEFFISATLNEGVLNYIHNRSSSKSAAIACRNIFEREGKLVFAPVSKEITKNFLNKKRKVITMSVNKNTYLAMLKIAIKLDVSINYVATNFIATKDEKEFNTIAKEYSNLQPKEIQLKEFDNKYGGGRPIKK